MPGNVFEGNPVDEGTTRRHACDLQTQDKRLCFEYPGSAGAGPRQFTRPLRVVPSSTGLPSKRFPGIGFFSRVYRKIGVFQHVVPPTRLRLEFPRAGPTHEEDYIPRRNSRIPPQLEKNHVVPTAWQDEALARHSVSKEVPRSY